MSKGQESVVGTIVLTMVVTAVGMGGGWYVVTQYLGRQTVTAGEEAQAEEPAPERKATQVRKGGTRTRAQSSTTSKESTPAEAPSTEGKAPRVLPDDEPGDEQAAAAAPVIPERPSEPPVQAAPSAPPDSETPADARTIMAESQRRSEAKFYWYDGLLQSFNADGKTSEKRWTFDRAGSNGKSKAVLRFTAPAEVKGVSLLIHNHPERASDQWMWTPALQRDRRIALQDRSTRFFGTDFSFEDLEERDVEQYDYSMLGSETIDGAACWKIETRPKKSRSSHYSRSVAWIRKDNYVMARLEHFVDDDLVKRLTNSAIENIQGIWTPRQLEMEDLRRRTRTRLTLQEVKYDAAVNDREFTLEAIRQ